MFLKKLKSHILVICSWKKEILYVKVAKEKMLMVPFEMTASASNALLSFHFEIDFAAET